MVTIALDVDDVILSLVSNWLKYYNKDFGDNLSVDKILDWDISKYVTPEAKSVIYEYVDDPDVFYTADAVEGAISGVKFLQNTGARVIFVTANNPGGIKELWLEQRGLLTSCRNFIQCSDKSLIRADLLLDDNFENIINFPEIGILFDRPWNTKYTYKNRALGWKGKNGAVSKILEQFSTGKL